MDLSGKTLWQVGAGDTERSYGELCIRHDVMIVGPGRPGPSEESRYANAAIGNGLRAPPSRS